MDLMEAMDLRTEDLEEEEQASLQEVAILPPHRSAGQHILQLRRPTLVLILSEVATVHPGPLAGHSPIGTYAPSLVSYITNHNHSLGFLHTMYI